jgi:thiamine biosynthesis lipoprotein
VVLGCSPDGQPWRIGVAHPYRPGELATIISAVPGQEHQPLAVATSGTSQRGSHIVNPLDGWRPVNGAVTVLGHDIAIVDAAATAVLAAGQPGPATQIAVVSDLGLQAFGFSESRTPWWTPGMPHYALLPATVA